MDWVFDEEQEATYSNPVYLEQMRRKGKEPDFSGFIEDEIPKEEHKDEPEEIKEETPINKETFDEEEDDDGIGEIDFSSIFDDEEEETVITESKPELKVDELKVTDKIKATDLEIVDNSIEDDIIKEDIFPSMVTEENISENSLLEDNMVDFPVEKPKNGFKLSKKDKPKNGFKINK